MNFRYILLFTCFSLLLFGCKKKEVHSHAHKPDLRKENEERSDVQKVLYVDSYHLDYISGKEARGAFKKSIEGLPFFVRYEFMDAKRKKGEDLQKKEALRIKAIVDSWKPDLIVAADDSVNKYLIAPYVKGTSIPVVFNGVNWEAESYGYPAVNVTGQIEVELIPELIAQLRPYAKGSKVGVLAGDTLTDRKSLKQYSEVLDLEFDQVAFVNSFEEWKRQFLRMQREVDILIFRNNTGIKEWDYDVARTFILNNVAIPVGSVSTHLAGLSLISIAKRIEEFGEITAEMVKDILLKKKKPGNIPLRKNVRSKLFLNMPLAQKLNILFPVELIESAQVIEVPKPRVLFINSYHEGYKWSDGIEAGVKAYFDLNKIPVDFKMFRMNTKVVKAEKFKKLAALRAKNLIEVWGPDVVIASDDNASKYLVEPYYKNSDIPFVFCGVNWDAGIYGFPCKNVTGIVEISTVADVVKVMSEYAKGTRIGFIASNTLSEHREFENFRDRVAIEFTDWALVDDFEQWKNAYVRLQSSVDMLVFTTYVGIKNWDEKGALDFIHKNMKIPSATVIEHTAPYVLFTRAKVAKEQGWKAASYAASILKGKKVSELPVIHNENYKQIINMKLANLLGLRLPVEVIKNSIIVSEEMETEQVP